MPRADGEEVPVRRGAGAFEDLLHLHDALGFAGTPAEVSRASLDVAMRVLGVAGAGIALVEGEEVATFASEGYGQHSFERVSLQADVPLGVVVREGTPRFFEDAAEIRAAYPRVAWSGGFEARAILPLRAGSRTWGALALSWREPRAFPREARGALEAFAAILAQSLWRAKRSQEAEEARAEFDDFVATASVGLHFVAADGTILWANPAEYELLGYSREEYVGHNIAEFHADKDDLGEILACLLSGERILNRPATLRHKDGSTRRVLIDSSARFVDGKFAHTRCFTRDVTALAAAQRKAEAAFVQERELHRTLLRAQSDLGEGVVLSRDRRIVFVNDACLRLVGRTREELLSDAFDPRVLFALGEFERVGEKHPFESLESFHYEARLQRSNGETFAAEVSSSAIDVSGARYRLSIIRDATETIRARESLQRRDAFLTSLTLKLLGSTLDPDESLRLVARETAAFFGCSASIDLFESPHRERRVAADHPDARRHALLRSYVERFGPLPASRQVLESIPAGEARIANDLDPQLVRAALPRPGEADLALAIGSRHSLLAPLRGRSGLLGGLTLTRGEGEAPFTAEDAFIVKSVVARAALAYENALLHHEAKKLENAWRALFERYERLIQTAPAQIITVNAAGRIVSLNRTVRGEPREAHVGRDAFRDLGEEERPRVRAIVDEAIRSGRPTTYETEALLPSGERRWFQVRVGPIELDDGPGAILVTTDIDEKKRAEQELAAMRAQLIHGEKMSALGSLVSGVAHELRTPLTFLSNNAFLLKRRLDDAARKGSMTAEARAEADKFLLEITAGVDRINQLVEDLRRYTRARLDGALATLPLSDAAADAVELFRATNRSAQRVEADLDRTALVRVNLGAVQQVVLNLLQNAAEASPPGGLVRLRTRDEGDRVALDVIDEGSGIPPHVQERMFEPLFTTKKEGTGLGLAIVKRIVDEHGATIECVSAPGKGTRFTVRFPRAQA